MSFVVFEDIDVSKFNSNWFVLALFRFERRPGHNLNLSCLAVRQQHETLMISLTAAKTMYYLATSLLESPNPSLRSFLFSVVSWKRKIVVFFNLYSFFIFLILSLFPFNFKQCPYDITLMKNLGIDVLIRWSPKSLVIINFEYTFTRFELRLYISISWKASALRQCPSSSSTSSSSCPGLHSCQALAVKESALGTVLSTHRLCPAWHDRLLHLQSEDIYKMKKRCPPWINQYVRRYVPKRANVRVCVNWQRWWWWVMDDSCNLQRNLQGCLALKLAQALAQSLHGSWEGWWNTSKLQGPGSGDRDDSAVGPVQFIKITSFRGGLRGAPRHQFWQPELA